MSRLSVSLCSFARGRVVVAVACLCLLALAMPVTQRALASTQKDFYFAEGYTGPGFQEFLCIGNTNTGIATVNVFFTTAGGATYQPAVAVPGNSRTTINVNQLLDEHIGPDLEVSMAVTSDLGVIAERSLYFNNEGWTGGSDVIGASAPSNTWYFAEGTTRDGFKEYITVYNPGVTTAVLNFAYMVQGEGEKLFTATLDAKSRGTWNAESHIGHGKDASLRLLSDRPVVAERPMYFDYMGIANQGWNGGHCVVGATSPSQAWKFAEGTTRSNFEEWLCLQNPNQNPITVKVDYQFGPGQGAPLSKQYTVPAKERLTVSVNNEVGPDKDVSMDVWSDADFFVAERPMYFNYNGVWDDGHDVLGSTRTYRTWEFAEGATIQNFDTWLCLWNPNVPGGDVGDVTVSITYLPESGQGKTTSYTVPAQTRLTVKVNADAGSGLSLSEKVTATGPIIVERPMYFDFGGWTGGHDVVGLPTP